MFIDPGDAFFKLIKEHKNQIVEVRHRNVDTEPDYYDQYPFVVDFWF